MKNTGVKSYMDVKWTIKNRNEWIERDVNYLINLVI